MKGTRFIGFLFLFAYMGYHVGKKVGSLETVMATIEEANRRYKSIRDPYGRKEGQE